MKCDESSQTGRKILTLHTHTHTANFRVGVRAGIESIHRRSREITIKLNTWVLMLRQWPILPLFTRSRRKF
jgi:hypothetical protein